MGIPLRTTFFTISPAKNAACFKDHEAIEMIALVYGGVQDSAGLGNIVPARCQRAYGGGPGLRPTLSRYLDARDYALRVVSIQRIGHRPRLIAWRVGSHADTAELVSSGDISKQLLY